MECVCVCVVCCVLCVVCRYWATHIHRLKPWIESFISQPVFHCFPLKEAFRYLFSYLSPFHEIKKFLKAPCAGSSFPCRAFSIVARGLSCPMPGMGDLSSPTRDQIHIPCIARQTLNHWTSREVPLMKF